MSPKWCILCRVGCEILTRSISWWKFSALILLKMCWNRPEGSVLGKRKSSSRQEGSLNKDSCVYLHTEGHSWRALIFECNSCWLGVRKSIQPVKNLSDEVLLLLSVWSEVLVICIWSSWCLCHPDISCFIKIQNGFTFLVPDYSGCPGKDAVKRVS